MPSSLAALADSSSLPSFANLAALDCLVSALTALWYLVSPSFLPRDIPAPNLILFYWSSVICAYSPVLPTLILSILVNNNADFGLRYTTATPKISTTPSVSPPSTHPLSMSLPSQLHPKTTVLPIDSPSCLPLTFDGSSSSPYSVHSFSSTASWIH
ncbi:hypothetical protein AN958_07404 [Leucoagaricus sp. SymC.cos]|nr:hypothetical protein AN958_07404 [Leucoagaricus sp. SymC.cos]